MQQLPREDWIRTHALTVAAARERRLGPQDGSGR
jgi:hypothetical protein